MAELLFAVLVLHVIGASVVVLADVRSARRPKAKNKA